MIAVHLISSMTIPQGRLLLVELGVVVVVVGISAFYSLCHLLFGAQLSVLCPFLARLTLLLKSVEHMLSVVSVRGALPRPSRCMAVGVASRSR